MKLGQNVCLDEISVMTSKLGHIGPNVGRILENPHIRSRGHIFSSMIIIKFGKNACLDTISDNLENGSYRVQKLVNRSNLKKKQEQ